MNFNFLGFQLPISSVLAFCSPRHFLLRSVKQKSKVMEGGRRDFLAFLGSDISVQILQCLDDPSDLVRVSSLSTSWRRLVIENSLCKQLCLQMFPRLSEVNAVKTSPSSPGDDVLVTEHRVYSCLANYSTNLVNTRIETTLLEQSRVGERPFYWTRKGRTDPQVPKNYVYTLLSDFCVITGIYLEPFEAHHEELDRLIYSAKAVRFHFGHSTSSFSTNREYCIDDIVWTYTSPVFPITSQRRGFQSFLIPEPVLCIRGFLQVELLGRIVMNQMDSLYYLGVTNVEALGRNLCPEFEVDLISEPGRCLLKHDPGAQEGLILEQQGSDSDSGNTFDEPFLRQV